MQEIAKLRDPGLTDTTTSSSATNHDSDDDEANAPMIENGEFSRFRAKNIDVKSVLSGRMTLEGLFKTDSQSGKLNAPKSQPVKNRNKAERILDSAAVLMSRHLRQMCEASLEALSNLFDQLNKPKCTEYSVFTMSLRVRKVGKRELANDLTEPVEVCLNPDLHDFKTALSGCVRQVYTHKYLI
jgi:hypothetical protein